MSRDIVEALNTHYGEPLPMNTGSPDAWSELIASWIEPAIREREAAAWERGWDAGADDDAKFVQSLKQPNVALHDRSPNPYRSGGSDTEQLQQQIDASEGEEHAGSDKAVGTHTPHNTPTGDENP